MAGRLADPEEGPLTKAIRKHAAAQAAEYLSDAEFHNRLGYQRHLYLTGRLHEEVDTPRAYTLPPAVQRAVDLLRIVFED